MSLSRREVSIGLVAAALVRCGERIVNPAPAEFPLGVASADPTSDGVLLWTRYVGSEPLDALVWRADAQASTALELAASGEYARVEVSGLEPGTTYRYAFVAGTRRSPEGRFRTAPAAGTRPIVRLGATSCTKQGHSMSPLARAAERELDAFLHLGDTVYADGSLTVNDYRDVWASAFSNGNYQALRASTALLATWDDHEIGNNWAGGNLGAERTAAGKQVFFEHMPARRTDRLWRSVRFGDTVEVFVLDSRGERDRAAGRYLSTEQMTWLKSALEASTARFKLLMSSVPISKFDVTFFSPFADDRWEGYPASRAEILSHIDDRQIPGVLWVAGDFHLACSARVSLDGPGKNAREVLVGPGGQLSNISPSYPSGPQFDWASGINNFTQLELDPATGIIRASWVDGTGREFHTTELSV